MNNPFFNNCGPFKISNIFDESIDYPFSFENSSNDNDIIHDVKNLYVVDSLITFRSTSSCLRNSSELFYCGS